MKKRTAVIATSAAALAAFLYWMKKRTQGSFAEAAGRAAGSAVVDLASGVVSGVSDAVRGAVESAVGVTPFSANPTGGRMLYDRQTNTLGLQGRIKEPEGQDKGDYIVEVQNTSDRPLSQVRVDLVTDKWGFDPVRNHVGTFDLPARSGILARGTVLQRSVTGLVPLTARLYANAYVIAKTDDPLLR